ncbi:hypothetical protein H5410_040966 [Solanum commersonii]|uniref:Uncharacterized protein n=1 Tax=Solanum commersonii TaxID=4109 RepID=A0A9J5XT35_SOLCO|nr:hypothetical protein H5410_040966 [Solanum commersonii]
MEEEEEEENDPDIFIIEEKAVSMLNATNEVFYSNSSICRTINKFKKFTDTTSYSELEFESSMDALQKN